MRVRNWHIFALIYLVAVTFILQYNLTHPIVNDGVFDYRTYLMNIEEGWKYRLTSVNSCLIPLWLPAMIQRLTCWDEYILFRVFSAFFYGLMPAFGYLIARRYLSQWESVASSLVVIFASSFIFFPDIGRVGIALGFMSGMIWALLQKKLLWALAFAVLLVFSHYATAVIAIGTMGAVWGFALLMKWFNPRRRLESIRNYVVVFSVLLILIGAWHFGVARYSGGAMVDAIFRPEYLQSTEMAKELMGSNLRLFSLEDRDAVTQEAFGMDFPNRPMPTKIEIISNWSIVGFITLGMFLMARKKEVDTQFKIMAIALYGLILAVIAIPSLSVFYVVQRVYFTATTVLAVCFPVGVHWISQKMHIAPIWLNCVVLVAYAVSTSGISYWAFGLEKSFPVILKLP